MTTIRLGNQTLEIKNEDKVLFPTSKVTKGELIQYYVQYAPRILPYLRGRPVGLERYPDGVTQEGFFQRKPAKHFPSWVERCELPSEEGFKHYLLCEDAASLIYFPTIGTVSFHAWLSKYDAPFRPTRMVFDIDPPLPVDEREVIQAAWDIKGMLGDLGLDSLPMSTGSRGLHVVVPLRGEDAFEEVRAFARNVVRRLALRRPASYTMASRRADREGKVYLDVTRNAYAQMTVVPYSVRPLPSAPVALPLSWSELEGDTIPKATLRELIAEGVRKDPWRCAGVPRQTLTSARCFFVALPDPPQPELFPLAS